MPGSRVDLARSQIGVAVRKGTPKPDISTVAKLREALLNAKSIAYSASASGTYLSSELFPKLGIEEQMKVTAKRIFSERVGAVVARGDAELGFQQVSELIYFKELDFIGTLPDEVQQTIFFSSALVQGAAEQDAAKQLVRFFTSPAVADIVRSTGQTVFMITHDVDEAILLADKIVLMTNGPQAKIAEIVVNTMPRNERHRNDLHRHPQYYAIRNHLVEFLVNRSRAFDREIADHGYDPRRPKLVKPGLAAVNPPAEIVPLRHSN